MLYAEEDPRELTEVAVPPQQTLTEPQEIRLMMLDLLLAECDREIERRRALSGKAG